jgi:uncharacterized membrane protein YadS
MNIGVLRDIGKFMIVKALTAIGLKTDLKKMIRTGVQPVFLGLTVWIAVADTSIVIQKFLGQW